MIQTRMTILTRQRFTVTLLTLAIALLLVILLAISLGASPVPVTNILFPGTLSLTEQTILWKIRMPRIASCSLLGAALAVSGVAFQALLRNPLADPYILGISGGASVGGVIALISVSVINQAYLPLGTPLFAFIGALLSIVFIERIARVNGQLSVFNILLTGVIFNAFAASIIYFLQSVASLQQLQDIVFYLMGRIPALSSTTLFIVFAVIVCIVVRFTTMGKDFNALSLGEDSAELLGVNVQQLKRTTFFLGSLLTAISVAFAGLIGFVGLIVPHILRLLIGSDHRLLFPASALAGASFLILADLGARLIIAPVELPVGVLTAFLGGPLFLYLLRHHSTRHV